jgi:hypothetical protein
MDGNAPQPELRPASSVGAWALLAVGLLLGLVTTWRVTGDPDAFWHLATGRLSAATGSTLPTDPFSFSHFGQPWRVKDLGGDLLLWGAFAAAGYAGVALLGALFFLPLPAALRSLAPRRSPVVPVLLAAVYLASVSMSATPRPRLFTLALFPLALVLLEQARAAAQRRAGNRELAIWFGATAMLVVTWLQLHRGGLAIAPLLVGLLLYLATARLLARWSAASMVFGPAPDHRGLIAAALLILAPLVAALLHPAGMGLLTSTFGVMNTEIYRQHVSEFQPISLHEAWLHFPALVLLAVAALVSAAVALRRLARGDASFSGVAWPAAVLLLFLVQAPGSVRWLPYLAAAALLLLVWFAARRPLRLAVPTRAPALVAATAMGAAFIHLASPHELGVGASAQMPAAAIAFARANQLGPRVHNAFHFGGYLIWAGAPGFQTLVDGRNDMVFDPNFFLECVTAEDDPAAFRALEQRLPSDWVLAANPGVSPAFGFLDRDPAFSPIFWSEPAAIYARRGRYPELEAKALRFIRPSDPVASLGAALRTAPGDPKRLAAIEDELLRMHGASPDGVQSNSLLVLFYGSLGPAALEQRDAYWSRLRQLAPGHPAVRELARRFNLALD